MALGRRLNAGKWIYFRFMKSSVAICLILSTGIYGLLLIIYIALKLTGIRYKSYCDRKGLRESRGWLLSKLKS